MYISLVMSDRQTDRQTYRLEGRRASRHADSQTERKNESKTGRWIFTQIDRQKGDIYIRDSNTYKTTIRRERERHPD